MKLKTLTTLSLSALLLTACGNNDQDNSNDSSNSNKPSKETLEKQVTQLDKVKTSPEDAIKKAQSEYSGQALKGISFEESNGEWVYKIEQQRNNEESEVVISDKNQKVLHKTSEKEDSVDTQDSFKYSEAIDYKEAVKKGQKSFNGDIKEWSLSKDDGKLVYDLDLKKDTTKHELTIDAKNGKVLTDEQED